MNWGERLNFISRGHGAVSDQLLRNRVRGGRGKRLSSTAQRAIAGNRLQGAAPQGCVAPFCRKARAAIFILAAVRRGYLRGRDLKSAARDFGWEGPAEEGFRSGRVIFAHWSEFSTTRVINDRFENRRRRTAGPLSRTRGATWNSPQKNGPRSGAPGGKGTWLAVVFRKYRASRPRGSRPNEGGGRGDACPRGWPD